MQAFSQATYALQAVADVKLNGLDLQERIAAKQALTDQERDSLLAALTGNKLSASASMQLQVALKEPLPDQRLMLTELQWLLLVDGKEALTGSIDEPLVLRHGLNTIAVETPILLTEVEGRPNYEGLSRIINLISRQGDLQKRVILKIKPTISTSLGEVESPAYITVSRPHHS